MIDSRNGPAGNAELLGGISLARSSAPPLSRILVGYTTRDGSAVTSWVSTDLGGGQQVSSTPAPVIATALPPTAVGRGVTGTDAQSVKDMAVAVECPKAPNPCASQELVGRMLERRGLSQVFSPSLASIDVPLASRISMTPRARMRHDADTDSEYETVLSGNTWSYRTPVGTPMPSGACNWIGYRCVQSLDVSTAGAVDSAAVGPGGVVVGAQNNPPHGIEVKLLWSQG
jgi:hypothetical protein